MKTLSSFKSVQQYVLLKRLKKQTRLFFFCFAFIIFITLSYCKYLLSMKIFQKSINFSKVRLLNNVNKEYLSYLQSTCM